MKWTSSIELLTVTLNRTKIGLKHGCSSTQTAGLRSLNRTMIGLKGSYIGRTDAIDTEFNRTKIGLKWGSWTVFLYCAAGFESNYYRIGREFDKK